MKKKFDFKLTACLVSLFIGLGLLIFFSKVKAVFFISLLLIALSVFFFAKIRVAKINNILQLTEKEIEEELEQDDSDMLLVAEVYKDMDKLKKQKRSMNITFNLFSILLVIVAFVSLF